VLVGLDFLDRLNAE